ncbi:TetR/AcrR family transcriptional regulator [Amycolatopsis silviterrae]|uniref:TetR/AcrR family transcriptional regulator n=1 Tax=Amycolatopsis silviterrae TaxID=1656914 RepID=A0ABW5HK95_9PSEU
MARGHVVTGTGLDRVAALGAELVPRRELWADVSSKTARKLVRAGVETFATRGFHGTSLRDIIAGTGLSTAALYVHFRSKEELLFEISHRGYTVSVEIVDAASAMDDPVEALQVLMYAFVRWQAEHHTVARVVFYQNDALNAEHRDALLVLRRDAERKVRVLLRRGIVAGAFADGDVRGIGAALLSLGIDVARWYGPRPSGSPDELGRLYSVLALRAVGVLD